MLRKQQNLTECNKMQRNAVSVKNVCKMQLHTKQSEEARKGPGSRGRAGRAGGKGFGPDGIGAWICMRCGWRGNVHRWHLESSVVCRVSYQSELDLRHVSDRTVLESRGSSSSRSVRASRSLRVHQPGLRFFLCARMIFSVNLHPLRQWNTPRKWRNMYATPVSPIPNHRLIANVYIKIQC